MPFFYHLNSTADPDLTGSVPKGYGPEKKTPLHRCEREWGFQNFPIGSVAAADEHVGGHPRFERAIGVIERDLDGEDQIHPFLLGLDVARREFVLLSDEGDLASEGVAGKGIYIDPHLRTQPDQPDLVFGDIDHQLDLAEVGDG